MRRLFGSIAIAWLLAPVAFVIPATGVFYPYHRITAVLVYAVSWIPFCFAFRNKGVWLRKHAGTARGFVKDYKWFLPGSHGFR